MQHTVSAKERWMRIGAVVLAVVMVFFAMTAAMPGAQAVTQQEISDLKSQASELDAQKQELQEKLDKLANSKDAALDEKFLLEEKINVLKEQIALSEQSIEELGEMIVQKEEELAQAKEEEAKYYDEYCQRVRSMEERGNVSYLSVLFNANSFSDLLDQINAIAEIVDYDNQVMDQLAAARQAVADAKADLEESKSAEEAAKADLETQKADLVAEEANVDAVIAEITSQSSVYAEKMDELEDDSANVSNQIAAAEKAYQAQLEAQKKAEEEAQKQQQNNSSSGSGSVPNGGGGSASSSGYLWPLSGYTRVSSPFGYRICPFHGQELHGGCDIPAPGGTPIMAAKSGVVVISTYSSSYGNYVVVAHGNGMRTLYAHLSARLVSPGQTVSRGQTIGSIGSTGSSTGNHLHYETWTGSSSASRTNPMNYF